MMVYKNCIECKIQIAYASSADMKRRSKTGKCRSCYLKSMPSGKDSNRWNGGVVIHSRGYRLIHKPEHPFAKGNGYVFEHRLVMEKHIGRYLEPTEIIHHLNGVKDDNRIENLIITNNIEHSHKYDAHSVPKQPFCSICPNKHFSNSFCKEHYWKHYLQKQRKKSGYNQKAAVRAREYRRMKKN